MKLLIAGRIAGSHHLLGAVKVVSDMDDLKPLLGERCMLKEKNGEVRLLTPKKIEKMKGNVWIFEFEEVKNKNEAGKIRGGLLEVRRDLLGFTEDDVFYNDYLSMKAIDADTGEELGIVEDIFETAAHAIFVVDSPKHEIMVPDLPLFVKKVDWDAREIHLHLLEGMKDVKKGSKDEDNSTDALS